MFDVVGGRIAGPAAPSLAWGGRYLAVGFASGTIPGLTVNEKAASRSIFDLVAAGRLAMPIDGRYRLEGAPDALEGVAERAVTGRDVLVLG